MVAVLAASAFTAAPASAQTQTVLAARAGASFATLGYESDPGVDIGYRRGVAVGVSITRYLTDNIGVRIGGTFASKGAEASSEGVTAVLKTSYVELSPMLDIRGTLARDRDVSLGLLIGPTVSFKRSCENLPPDGVPRSCENSEVDVASVDVGATIGVGFRSRVLREPTVALSAEALYTRGFREVQNVDNTNAAKSRAFSVQAGISFPIG